MKKKHFNNSDLLTRDILALLQALWKEKRMSPKKEHRQTEEQRWMWVFDDAGKTYSKHPEEEWGTKKAGREERKVPIQLKSSPTVPVPSDSLRHGWRRAWCCKPLWGIRWWRRWQGCSWRCVGVRLADEVWLEGKRKWHKKSGQNRDRKNGPKKWTPGKSKKITIVDRVLPFVFRCFPKFVVVYSTFSPILFPLFPLPNLLCCQAQNKVSSVYFMTMSRHLLAKYSCTFWINSAFFPCPDSPTDTRKSFNVATVAYQL